MEKTILHEEATEHLMDCKDQDEREENAEKYLLILQMESVSTSFEL